MYLGWLPRQKQNKEVEARAMRQQQALPIVQVVTARQSPSTEELTLPGTVVPVSTTHIYARAAGYVKALNVDIGDTVHPGQLLAVIDAPELSVSPSYDIGHVLQAQRSLSLATRPFSPGSPFRHSTWICWGSSAGLEGIRATPRLRRLPPRREIRQSPTTHSRI